METESLEARQELCFDFPKQLYFPVECGFLRNRSYKAN